MQVSQSERNTMWKAVTVLFFCFVVDSSSFFARYSWHDYSTVLLPRSVKLVFVVCFLKPSQSVFYKNLLLQSQSQQVIFFQWNYLSVLSLSLFFVFLFLLVFLGTYLCIYLASGGWGFCFVFLLVFSQISYLFFTHIAPQGLNSPIHMDRDPHTPAVINT